MAMNVKAEKLPYLSAESAQVLAGLYRSTFTGRMQERFRLMLAGAYSVYVTALGEEFDPALRAHLSDVLHNITAGTAELADVFEEELMRSFREALEPSGSPDGSAHMDNPRPRQTVPVTAFDDNDGEDDEIQGFIAKTVKSYETRYGSIILAVTRTFVKLTDQSVENFRPPWTPTKLFSAFSVVLQHVGMPVHGKVRLALYKMFSQEVLRYLGDGCMDFRYVLPHSLLDLNKPERESILSSASIATLAEVSPLAPNDKGGATAYSTFPAWMLESTHGPLDTGEASHSMQKADISANAPPLENHQLAQCVKPGSRKFLSIISLLIGCGALMVGSWLMGGYAAKNRLLAELEHDMPVSTHDSSSEQVSASLSSQNAIAVQPPALTPSISGTVEQAKGTVSNSAILRPSEAYLASPVAPHGKREALKAMKLKNFAWTHDPGKGELLFTFTLMNTGQVDVGQIEIVCSQYSDDLDFLEAAKAVLVGPIEAGQAKVFKAVPIGFANKQTKRVNCVLADLDAMPPQHPPTR